MVVFLSNNLGVLFSAVLSLPHVNSRYILIGGENTRPLKDSHYCREYIEFGSMGLEGALALNGILKDLMSRYGPLEVVPIEEQAICLACAASEGLSLVVVAPQLALVQNLSNKFHFYKVCREAGIPVPATVLVSASADATPELIQALGDVVVAKPVVGGGGDGVRICPVERYLADVEGTAGLSCPQVVQTFIDGDDIDISILASAGRCVLSAIQMTTEGGLVFLEDESLLAHGRRLMEFTGYTGLVHIDARRERGTGQLFLIEANTRIWASMTHAALAGMNFLEAAMHQAGGKEISPQQMPASDSPVTWKNAGRAALLARLGLVRKSRARQVAVLRRAFDPVLRRALLGRAG